jgi:hypothetical protein
LLFPYRGGVRAADLPREVRYSCLAAFLFRFCVESPIGACIDYQTVIHPVMADCVTGNFAAYLQPASVFATSNESGYHWVLCGLNGRPAVRK